MKSIRLIGTSILFVVVSAFGAAKNPLAKFDPQFNHEISDIYFNPPNNTVMVVSKGVLYSAPSKEADKNPGHLYLVKNEDFYEMKKYVALNGHSILPEKNRNIIVYEDENQKVDACIGCNAKEIAGLGIDGVDPNFFALLGGSSLAKSFQELASQANNAKNKPQELLLKAEQRFGPGGANFFRQLMLPDGNQFCAMATAPSASQSAGSMGRAQGSFDPSGSDMVSSLSSGGAVEGGRHFSCNQSSKPAGSGKCGDSSFSGGGSGCGHNIGCNSGVNSRSDFNPNPRQAFMNNLAKKGYAMEDGGTDGGTAPQEDSNNGSPPPNNDRPLQPNEAAGDYTFHKNVKKDSPEQLKFMREKIDAMCKFGCERTHSINRAFGTVTTVVRSRWDGQVWQRTSVKGVITPDQHPEELIWRRYETPIEPEGDPSSPFTNADMPCPGDWHFVVGGNKECGRTENSMQSRRDEALTPGGRTGPIRPGGDGGDFLTDSTGAQTPTTYVYDDGGTCTSARPKKSCIESGDIQSGEKRCSHLNIARIKDNMLKQRLWTDPPIWSSGMAVPVNR